MLESEKLLSWICWSLGKYCPGHVGVLGIIVLALLKLGKLLSWTCWGPGNYSAGLVEVGKLLSWTCWSPGNYSADLVEVGKLLSWVQCNLEKFCQGQAGVLGSIVPDLLVSVGHAEAWANTIPSMFESGKCCPGHAGILEERCPGWARMGGNAVLGLC